MRIEETHIAKGLEKPPQMDPYYGTTYPDKNIENIEAILDYHNILGAVRGRLFSTTL
jgi:hypothetical protein